MIQPEQIADQTLEQLMSPNDKEAYKMTKEMAETYLFSRYPERRTFAKKLLEKHWDTPVDIHTIEDSNILYAYIELNHVGKYVLLGKYRQDSPPLETIPSEEERELWECI